ncbi:cytochrome c biogenesis CcdA family protein [Clostridium sp.]|uniref:cytochrome c biogenesis CcdA family protein n=1 Tax=Clostridium sp. TaxID=1506 RepID=UPI002601ACA6|nr:cytochrome c biogenesis CcdA family protein [Clostridium sp.]
MEYLILFLEGIITFISPCILPMLPIYATYFIGGKERSRRNVLINSIGFVLGFSIIFTLLGGAAGTLGIYINSHIKTFNIISGIIMIIFGLNYIGVIKLNFLERTFKLENKVDLNKLNVISSIIFGIIFAVGWTPCVGTFLGSALMVAANSQETFKGVTLLLSYSLGLGIPFIISALLINNLKGAFKFIKKNYKVINNISGTLLIIIGLFMISGYFNKFISLFSV